MIRRISDELTCLDQLRVAVGERYVAASSYHLTPTNEETWMDFWYKLSGCQRTVRVLDDLDTHTLWSDIRI